MIHLKPATIKEALEVASNLRPEDKSELEGMGYSPFQVVLGVLFTKDPQAFYNYQGELAGVGGVIPDEEGSGYIWMLCTPAVQKLSVAFYRQARRHLSTLEKQYKMLYSNCDHRNSMHHRLLTHLGFKAINTTPVGPLNLPYYEVVKLCAPPL